LAKDRSKNPAVDGCGNLHGIILNGCSIPKTPPSDALSFGNLFANIFQHQKYVFFFFPTFVLLCFSTQCVWVVRGHTRFIVVRGAFPIEQVINILGHYLSACKLQTSSNLKIKYGCKLHLKFEVRQKVSKFQWYEINLI